MIVYDVHIQNEVIVHREGKYLCCKFVHYIYENHVDFQPNYPE